MTPHMGEWYAEGAGRPGERDTIPGDWHDPVPVQFLVASRPRFQFALAPRPGAADAAADLPDLVQALGDALEWLGAGAKTAVGYGVMSKAAKDPPGGDPEAVWEGVTLRYAKGQQRLSTRRPDGAEGFLQGEEAWRLYGGRSARERKDLDKGRLRADVRVRRLGGRNWQILGWADRKSEGTR